MVIEVSLIIPSQNADIKLHELLRGIPNWESVPNEIIIVDSSEEESIIPKDIELPLKKLNVDLLMIYENNLYPGHARNIGISNASNSVLAFLDTSTQPTSKWLSDGLSLMKAKNLDGVWGKTYYQANAFSSKIFRACTFGTKPIRTFPGSILNKKIFNRCGLFIESTRAGEDGDWMSRAELQEINIATPQEILNYDQLSSMSIKKLIKKWFRNNMFAAKLPFYRAHRDFYYYAISFVAVVIAFNWNWILASWDEESIFFIPNITKISILIILIIYIFMRGIFLPRKKGVNLSFIFPINFIFIFLLSVILDLTKALAFAYSKFNR
tara:strand:+ start:4389 stop:5360 length:972 start_codon:yes stop_codon:yes gene_type:complete